MKVSPINTASNLCTFQVDLTWDQAKALYELAPVLIAALGTALRDRTEAQVQRKASSDQLDRTLETQKKEWATLAADCEDEIRRRSNAPGARESLIKQLAAERGISRQLLGTILRVHRRQAQSSLRSHRIKQVTRLEAKGHTQREIAALLRISERQVRNYLAMARRGTL